MSASVPVVKFSRDIDEKKAILAHMDKQFGYSLIAMTVLNDNKKENLSIEIQFADIEQLRDCAIYLQGVWEKSESYQCGLRCYVVDDKPLEEFNGITYSTNTAPPVAEDDYKSNKFLIDSFSDDQSHVFKIYSRPSLNPKIVKLLLRYEDDASATV